MSSSQEKPKQYLVRNPIARGGLFYAVKVLGVPKGSNGPYVVDRNMVIECYPGSEAAVEKWKRNRCLEEYDPKKHKEIANLNPEPEAPEVLLETPMVPEDQAEKKAEKDAFDQSAPITEEEPDEEAAPAKRPSEQASPIVQGTKAKK